MISCENFDCSFERFKDLATECGDCSPSRTRDAILILEGEMRYYSKNTYWTKSPTFIVACLSITSNAIEAVLRVANPAL